MDNIPQPTSLTVVPGTKPAVATVTIEPFYPGYGTTIGNSLRRVLLSSLPGAAITAFRVKGVPHEFSTLPHVKEDFVDISLNLKRVRLKVFSNEPVRLRLEATGERVVTAGDIQKSSDVEIISADQVIATLTDPAASLEIELAVRAGRGYETIESHEKETLEVGMIALDALYSPVRKVGFQVENVRVGQMTNWDKLVLDIETDGTITPEEAVTLANQYLIEQFTGLAERLRPAADAPPTPAAEPLAPEVLAPTDAPQAAAPEISQPAPAAETKPKRRAKKSVTP